ncbi:hypothetical protein KJ781_04420 [Patescibacteria group bacterium]|nr:hypothetical protein [Patescibacteria group bacterium]MBU1449072.1 hypothetical protein [Patescibacteria group bacterium]
MPKCVYYNCKTHGDRKYSIYGNDICNETLTEKNDKQELYISGSCKEKLEKITKNKHIFGENKIEVNDYFSPDDKQIDANMFKECEKCGYAIVKDIKLNIKIHA